MLLYTFPAVSRVSKHGKMIFPSGTIWIVTKGKRMVATFPKIVGASKNWKTVSVVLFVLILVLGIFARV